MDARQIFDIKEEDDFNSVALQVFAFQYQHNHLYQEFCNHLSRTPEYVSLISDIPFLPISFFKSHKVVCTSKPEEIIFSSSGTTGSVTSKHYVSDLQLYVESFRQGFSYFYGDI